MCTDGHFTLLARCTKYGYLYIYVANHAISVSRVYLPAHVTPSPLNPELQAHVNPPPPSTLVQPALASQLSASVAHSSRSVCINETKKKHFILNQQIYRYKMTQKPFSTVNKIKIKWISKYSNRANAIDVTSCNISSGLF